MSSLAPGIKGNARLGILKLHRLAEFQVVFDLYLDGRATAAAVTARARKMLEVGLPRLR